MLRSLSIPGVRRLTGLYGVADLLEWCGAVALMLLVFEHTGSALAAGGMLICKQILPAAFSPFTGRLLDRAPTVRMVALGFWLQAAAFLAVGAVGYGPALFVLAAASGLGGTLVRASFRATIARSYAGEERRSANALVNATMGIMSLIGPGFAAAFATAASPQTALAITGAAGLLAGGAAAFTSGPQPQTAKGSAAEGEPVDLHDTEVPDRHGAPKPLPLPLWVLLSFTAVIAVGLAMDEPSLLPYAERSLGAGAGAYGAILSFWGVGIIVGSIGFGRLLHVPMLTVAAAGTAVTAIGYIGLSAAPTVAVACLVAAFGGVGNGFSWVALVTAVQEATPPGRQGQAAARLEAIITAGPAVGYLLGGAIADAASPRLTLLIPGVLALTILALGTLVVNVGPVARARAASPSRLG